MATLTIDIPDSKATDLSKYAKKIGGKVKEQNVTENKSEEKDEVTHEVFFGENIRRVINAFKK